MIATRHTPLSPTSLAVRHQGPTCRGYLDGTHKSYLSHTGRAAHLVGQYSVDEIQYGVGAGGSADLNPTSAQERVQAVDRRPCNGNSSSPASLSPAGIQEYQVK